VTPTLTILVRHTLAPTVFCSLGHEFGLFLILDVIQLLAIVPAAEEAREAVREIEGAVRLKSILRRRVCLTDKEVIML